jgi:hypothetical protein
MDWQRPPGSTAQFLTSCEKLLFNKTARRGEHKPESVAQLLKPDERLETTGGATRPSP